MELVIEYNLQVLEGYLSSVWSRTVICMRHEQVLQKVSVIVEGKPNQLHTQGMQLFEQYDELCKYFAKGKQEDNDTNEVQMLPDLSMGEYVTDKYAL